MKYYIGIDGGGTKTAVRLVDENKNILSDIRVGRSNHADTGMEESLTLITDSIKTVAAQANVGLGEIESIYAGIAGSTSNNYAALCRERIVGILPNATVEVANDASILFVRLEKGVGAVMICGTGSICFTFRNGVTRRIGGYGDLDIFGSGSDIGKQALAYSLRVTDGRAENGILNRLIERKNGAPTLQVMAALIRGGKPVYASYAPLVFEAYRNGDPEAAKILAPNFDHLAGYLKNAKRDFDGPFDVVAAGGIFKDVSTLGLIRERLDFDVNFIFADDTVDCAVDSAIKKLSYSKHPDRK